MPISSAILDLPQARKTCAAMHSMFSGMPCRHIVSTSASITPRLLMRRATFNARQARLCSSIRVRMRRLRPSCVWACTKSKLQT